MHDLAVSEFTECKLQGSQAGGRNLRFLTMQLSSLGAGFLHGQRFSRVIHRFLFTVTTYVVYGTGSIATTW